MIEMTLLCQGRKAANIPCFNKLTNIGSLRVAV